MHTHRKKQSKKLKTPKHNKNVHTKQNKQTNKKTPKQQEQKESLL